MEFYRPRGFIGGFGWHNPDRLAEVIEAGEQWSPRDQPITEHRNKGWEIYYQPKGSSLWACGKRRFEIGPGGFSVMAPDVGHRLVEFSDEETHFYFAVISRKAVAPFEPGSGWPRPFGVGSGGGPLEIPFRGLIRELTLDRGDRRRGLACYSAALCLETSRLLAGRGEAAKPSRFKHHPAVDRVVELLEDQPGRAWKLDELAALCGLSVPHLIVVFRKSHGQTPRQYLLRRRIERAEDLLGTTDRPITEIALDLGFASSQHFATAFRKVRGHAPRKVRS